MKTQIVSTLFKLTAGLLVAGFTATSLEAQTPKKVLVVTVTKGFRHSSIETAEEIIAKLGKQSGAFTVDYARVTPPKLPRRPTPPRTTGNEEKDKAAKEKYDTELAEYRTQEPKIKETEKAYADEQEKVLAEKMSLASLNRYDAVIFANTTGDLPLPDRDGFIAWVKAGHAFIAMHSGSDTFHGYQPYLEMLGGEFQIHGAQVGVECLVQDAKHPATRHLGSAFTVKQEEMYIIKNYDPTKVHELLVLDKHPNQKTPGHFAVSWCKEFGQGKIFYTSLGHREDVWDTDSTIKNRINAVEISEAYQKHILGGIKWALGLEPGDATPQTK